MYDDTIQDEVTITVIATGLDEPDSSNSGTSISKTFSNSSGLMGTRPAGFKPSASPLGSGEAAAPRVDPGQGYNRSPIKAPDPTVTRREINVPGFLKK